MWQQATQCYVAVTVCAFAVGALIAVLKLPESLLRPLEVAERFTVPTLVVDVTVNVVWPLETVCVPPPVPVPVTVKVTEVELYVESLSPVAS